MEWLIGAAVVMLIILVFQNWWLLRTLSKAVKKETIDFNGLLQLMDNFDARLMDVEDTIIVEPEDDILDYSHQVVSESRSPYGSF